MRKNQWNPKSTARRRLERLRTYSRSGLSTRHNKDHRSRSKYRQSCVFSPPPVIDHLHKNKIEYKTIITNHPQKNKKLDNNKTITDTLPFIYFFDPPPEYKVYSYWEVKAG